MTDQEINVAIAEACGWTKCRLAVLGAGGGMRQPTAHGFPPGRKYEASCPDYCTDLNAMHEAEKALTNEQRENYICALVNVVQMRRTNATINSDYYLVASATASQRARAWLRTIRLP